MTLIELIVTEPQLYCAYDGCRELLAMGSTAYYVDLHSRSPYCCPEHHQADREVVNPNDFMYNQPELAEGTVIPQFPTGEDEAIEQ